MQLLSPLLQRGMRPTQGSSIDVPQAAVALLPFVTRAGSWPAKHGRALVPGMGGCAAAGRRWWRRAGARRLWLPGSDGSVSPADQVSVADPALLNTG